MAEQRGQGRSLYFLHHLWEQLKEYSEKSGESISSIVQWCVAHGLEAWEKTHLKEVKDKVVESVKGKSKGEELSEAYHRNVLFGDLDLKQGKLRDEEDLFGIGSDLDLFVDYRKKKRRIDWQAV